MVEILKSKNNIYLYNYHKYYEVVKNNENVGITLLLTFDKQEALDYFNKITA